MELIGLAVIFGYCLFWLFVIGLFIYLFLTYWKFIFTMILIGALTLLIILGVLLL